jgi:hypothetical protein
MLSPLSLPNAGLLQESPAVFKLFPKLTLPTFFQKMEIQKVTAKYQFQ